MNETISLLQITTVTESLFRLGIILLFLLFISEGNNQIKNLKLRHRLIQTKRTNMKLRHTRVAIVFLISHMIKLFVVAWLRLLDLAFDCKLIV